MSPSDHVPNRASSASHPSTQPGTVIPSALGRDGGMPLPTESLGVGTGPRSTGRVERGGHRIAGSADQGEQVAARPACVREDNTDDGVGGDGGVDGVPAGGDTCGTGLGRRGGGW